MPLLRRKPFSVAEPPDDLEPHESVYQIRFTKEIFRDYNDYLNCLNQYRKRVWMCKVTGKTCLTYEEALVSEKCATEKVQQIPQELMAPALRIIQYSMLPLKDLADSIAEKLQEQLFVGAQLYGKKNDNVCPCKILKVMQEDVENVHYVVDWLDKNNNIIERAEVSSRDLIQKKPPFSRNILKSFIRESTYRNAPWVLCDKLAKKHGISTDIPEELRGKVFFNNELVVCTKKRKAESYYVQEESIKYPIDDLLVRPSPDDPVFSSRPSPSRDFNVPTYCVGDLLMVWDFFMSFGKLLRLWPYTLKDFENAISHKDSNVVLLVESHAVLFRVLIKGDDEYSAAVQEKVQKKITMINWKDYLCDFLEMINIPKLRQYEATIKRGHYGYVDVNGKLEIFRELVNRALETAIVREKLDEFIEQRQVLGANKREEAIKVAGKRRKEMERLKVDSQSNCGENGRHVDHDASVSPNNNHKIQNGDIGNNRNGEIKSSMQKDALESGIKNSNLASKRTAKMFDSELNGSTEIGKITRKESKKQPKGDKDQSDKSKEHRREYFDREMEKWCIRASPLGKDRHYNRYWWFHLDGRIFVESLDSKEWGYYSSKEELDALMSSLNCKGERERALQNQLEKYYSRICSGLQKSSKVLMHRITLDDSVARRSSRVRAPPREHPAKAFLRYVNKWKEGVSDLRWSDF
ncbi:DDT domain-containing protein DDB_G0282237 [Cajanus cajan]|uniref:DDT domain-containing protein DDB_G0282237 n=1 Tax=Cajanus cajan TaxID=3821 RepID=UPI00098D9ABE|nr:DDT domain-containing protein DDB_G0282237 [Cajanus cajan]XP_020201969.1 DDT domain-containing protein DDB_G0282237 [Cajanus cajan]